MNNIGTTPTQNLPNLVTPFSPPSKNLVGLESRDNKDTVLPPVEETNKSHRGLNRRQIDDSQVHQGFVSDEGNDTDSEQASAEAEELEKQAVIRQLAARDREVRQHEAVHAAVGGTLAGTPQFSYVRGPDGVMYANAGEVPIKLSVISSDPEVQLKNAEQVQRAALAPDEPSAQDRRVAAQAAQLAQQARADIAAQQLIEMFGNEEKNSDTKTESKTSTQNTSLEAARAQKFAERYDDNKRRLSEIQESATGPVKDLARRLLELDKVAQNVDIGHLLNQRV